MSAVDASRPDGRRREEGSGDGRFRRAGQDDDAAVVRSMRMSDLPRVTEIERETFSMPWSDATFRHLLARTDAEACVAARGDVVVGYAVFWAVVDQAELGDIAVTEAWRGLGLGSRLLAEVERRAIARGVRRLYLEVRASNHGARRLYERNAFRVVGRRRDYYVRPVEDALVMCKNLLPE